MCAGFKAATGDAHCLIYETKVDVVYLEIGDRTAGDAVEYPHDDIAVVTIDGKRKAAHKEGCLTEWRTAVGLWRRAFRGPPF